MTRLSRKLQIILAGSVAVLFCIFIGVVWLATTMSSMEFARQLAESRVRELGISVRALSDRHMLHTAHVLANAVGSADKATNGQLYRLLGLFNVSEIHVIGDDGIIHHSTVPADINWNMAGGEQSAEFLQLLHGVEELTQPLQPKANGGTPIRYVGVRFPEGGGFLQAALDEESFQRNLRDHAEDIAELLRVRAHGFVLLANEDLVVQSTPPGVNIPLGSSLADFLNMSPEQLRNERPETLFRADTRRGPAFCYLSSSIPGLTLLVIQAEPDVFAQRNALIPVLAAAELPLFLVFFLLVSWCVQHFFADDVVSIDKALGRIASGDLNQRVDVRSCAEFASLSDNINKAAAALRRHAEAERVRLKRERDAAIAAEKSRRFFFASVSHDIRTPLNSIIGFSQLLKLGGVDEATRHKYLDSIVASGEVLMQLINDVLDLSRLEAGKMVFSNEWCDIGRIVADTLAAFELRAREAGLTLASEIPPSLPQVSSDPHRLRQILFNLVGNAIKFTARGGIRISVRWLPSGNPAQGDLGISVSDTGIGISKEDLARLGRPFEQLTIENGQRGTGLGLAICKQMIRRMGGEMLIESELGRGSTFTIVLHDASARDASAEPDAPADATAPAAPNAEDLAKLHLLLVDDMKLNLVVLASLCHHLGIQHITTAESGSEALDHLRKERFDLVLTDLWMPGMDGAALVAAIHADPMICKTPVCVVTADVEVRKTFRETGFDDLLLKPVQVDALRELVTAHARKHQGGDLPPKGACADTRSV